MKVRHIHKRRHWRPPTIAWRHYVVVTSDVTPAPPPQPLMRGMIIIHNPRGTDADWIRNAYIGRIPK